MKNTRTVAILLTCGLLVVGAAGSSWTEAAPAQLEVPFDANYSLESRTAIGAHHLCSGMWVVGRDYPRTARQVLADDIRPFGAFGWDRSFEYVVDEDRRSVTVRSPTTSPRTAVYNGDQGCTILPRGEQVVLFQPTTVPRNLPDAETTPWPMGDADATTPIPTGVDAGKVGAALDWAIRQESQNTRSIVVVYEGKIIGERYAPGWTKDTPQISWSEGKSITAALVGIMVEQGAFELDDFAPVPEWRKEGDPRGEIRIRDLLRMSSGLEFANLGLSGPESYRRDNEHMRIYFDGLNVFEHASSNQPQELPPNTANRYRNSDPLTLGRIVREAVEARGSDYLKFPQQALFDKIGARNFVLETDAWGNFIMTGFDYGSARDWARFGLLHLWDGVWEGERILPEGWVEFVSTPAPADPSMGYGGLFWLNRGGPMDRVPEDAFWASGFMGQITMIIPSRDLVITRQGPSPGGGSYFNEFVGRLLEGLPSD